MKRYAFAALALPPLALLWFASHAPTEPGTATVRAPHVRAAVPASEHASPVGVNVAELHYWAGQLVFADLFRQASRWYRENLTTWAWDSGPPLEVDENGWVKSLLPNQAASVLIARGPNALLPEGTYDVRWDGKGTLTATANAAAVSTEPGHMVMVVEHSTTAGIQLRLMATDPTDPLRNIRVYPPGIDPDAAPLFHPRFLQLLSNFRAIRFMDWQRTNGSPLVEWSERTPTSDAVQTDVSGVALEYMVELCNTLHCDAWFCMPHRASDEFVTNFAKFVETRLDPSLKVFVEYSNELWNGGFEQAAYAAAKGAELGLSGSAFQNQLRFGSKRAVQIFGLWRSVFGAASTRLVCVLAGQSVNTWTGQVILDFEDAYQHADAYAVAPYFGARLGSPQEAPGVLALTPDEWKARLFLDIQDSFQAINMNVALAEDHGLALVAYEGGQHLVGTGGMQENAALTDLFVATNRSAVMGDLYDLYLAKWKESGAHEMFLWNLASEPSKFGSWGLLENTSQRPQDSYKFRAVTVFNSNNQPWW